MTTPLGERVVRAAGTLPWRVTGAELEVALVHRPRYDDWAWAKGKLDPGEHWPEAAARETAEETGIRVHLRLPLPTARYQLPSAAGDPGDPADPGNPGNPVDPVHPVDPIEKVVRYWAARVEGGDGSLDHEVDEVRWMAARDAPGLLTYARDRVQLDALRQAHAAGLLAAWPLAIVRHTRALPRKAWSGDDWLRPLNARGQAQARDLVGLLGAFGIQRIVTSSATRCVDSIVPYARAIGVKPQTSKWLSEEGYTAAPHWLPSVVAETLEAAEPALLCSHGPVLPDLLRLLADRAADEGCATSLAQAAADKLRKGEALVAHVLGAGERARVVAVERHPPVR